MKYYYTKETIHIRKYIVLNSRCCIKVYTKSNYTNKYWINSVLLRSSSVQPFYTWNHF